MQSSFWKIISFKTKHLQQVNDKISFVLCDWKRRDSKTFPFWFQSEPHFFDSLFEFRWIVKFIIDLFDSWGTSWGVGGFGFVPYQYILTKHYTHLTTWNPDEIPLPQSNTCWLENFFLFAIQQLILPWIRIRFFK